MRNKIIALLSRESGLNQKQIAQRIGVPVTAIASHMHCLAASGKIRQAGLRRPGKPYIYVAVKEVDVNVFPAWCRCWMPK